MPSDDTIILLFHYPFMLASWNLKFWKSRFLFSFKFEFQISPLQQTILVLQIVEENSVDPIRFGFLNFEKIIYHEIISMIEKYFLKKK